MIKILNSFCINLHPISFQLKNLITFELNFVELKLGIKSQWI
jgi:hypothetical protein